MTASPRLLITGFGTFPDVPDNVTGALVTELAAKGPERFGAAALRAEILPTDYRRSWPRLRRLYAAFDPDVVVHFGLSPAARSILVETLARRRTDAVKPDAAGYAPPGRWSRRSGPAEIASTLPTEKIVAALQGAGFPAAASDDAGAFVCNATLYRSLDAARMGRKVGFVHVPPAGVEWPLPSLCAAAAMVLAISCGDRATRG